MAEKFFESGAAGSHPIPVTTRLKMNVRSVLCDEPAGGRVVLPTLTESARVADRSGVFHFGNNRARRSTKPAVTQRLGEVPAFSR